MLGEKTHTRGLQLTFELVKSIHSFSATLSTVFVPVQIITNYDSKIFSRFSLIVVINLLISFISICLQLEADWPRNKMSPAKFATKLKGKTGSNARVARCGFTAPAWGTARMSTSSLANRKTSISSAIISHSQLLGKQQYRREKLPEDVAKLTKSIESVKKTLCEMASASQATTESTSTDKDKYPPSRRFLRNFELEVRLSGLPELKASTKEIQNEKSEKVLMKTDRKEIFEHEENLIYDVVNHLGVDKNEILGFHRLGKYDKNSTRSRQMLVKFKNSYNVDKLLARASMLKTYEPEYMNEKYKVYISKSLDKEQQLLEQKILKKRREMIGQENHYPRDISIRNGVLCLNHKPVKIEA